MAQAIFEPNPFPNTPTHTNLILSSHTYLPMKMEKTECSETSEYKIQTPGNNPDETTQYNFLLINIRTTLVDEDRLLSVQINPGYNS